MRKIAVTTFAALVLVGLAVVPSQAAVTGDYLEVRNADIWTGPCFASSQVNLAGKRAILVWKITNGSWKGTNLSGLAAVAVVKASATFGNPYTDPYPAKAVLILDQKATPQQREALESFVKFQAARLVDHIVRVDVAPISLKVGTGAEHGVDVLKAGNLALVRTRALGLQDIICGNETVYYPPLTRVQHSMPAFAREAAFDGKGLGVVWNNRDGRSAFVGTFSN